MAYLYVHYEIDNDLKKEIPFYIGMSNQPVIEYKEFTGSDSNEIIKDFIETPYIRMYDFGPASHHGFKAKLSFEESSDKSIEYQEFIKDKIWKKDYDSKVLFETDNIETIYYLEFLLVKKFGFRHDKGQLFNKIPGGCKLINGKLQYQFSFEYLLDNLNDGSLTHNPNWNFTNEETGYKIEGLRLTDNNVYPENWINDFKKHIKEEYVPKKKPNKKTLG
jgi:hypothetical protein